MALHTPKLGSRCHCLGCCQRRWWTPERKAARSAEYRIKVAGGAQFGSHKPKRIACRWLPEHDTALGDLLGKGDVTWIAAELTRRFDWPRTEEAVRSRIKKLKLSRLTVRPWSCRELVRLLGVSDDTVRSWIVRGLLVGTPWRLGGGRRKGNVSQAFTRADVERFLRAHPGLVHPGRIRDAGLRALVEGVTRGRRPLTIPEAARLANVRVGTLRYWCKVGKVPTATQADGCHWRISAVDLALLRVMPDGRTREARGAS
jgi:DNA-binding transcriptional MerR regulator